MTKQNSLGLAPVAVAMLLGAGPAAAHHSRSNFDLDTVVEVEGTVVRVAWTNPHTAIHVETVTPEGETVEMTIEGNSIATMIRRGWTEDTLKPGDRVVVRANPDNDPDRHFYYLNAIMKDGVEVGGNFDERARTENARAATESEDDAMSPFVGVWQPIFSFGGGGGGRSILLSSPMPGNLPVTEKGAASYAEFDGEDDPRNDCIPESLPEAISTAPYLLEIRRSEDGNFVFLNENYAAPRVIHMDQSAPPAGTERDHDGYSVGRIEDDALVIETALFTPEPWGNDTGLASGEQKHVVERYRVLDDGERLQVNYAQADPEYLTRIVSRTLNWSSTDAELANVWDGSNCSPAAGRRHITAE